MRRTNESDIPDIQEWFYDRKMEIPPSWFFSDVGLIVPDVAAGFLYLTNSGIATLDGFVANPHTRMIDRFMAVKAVTAGLVTLAAQTYEVKMLCCTSKIPSIKRIANEFGFQSMGLSEGFFKTLNS